MIPRPEKWELLFPDKPSLGGSAPAQVLGVNDRLRLMLQKLSCIRQDGPGWRADFGALSQAPAMSWLHRMLNGTDGIADSFTSRFFELSTVGVAEALRVDPPNSRTGDLWGLTLRTLDPVEDWLLNDCRYHETAMIGAERGAFFIGDKEHVITAKADLLLVASELHRRLAGSDSPTSGKRRLPVESDSLLVLAEEGARMALELTHGHKRGTLPAPYFLPPVLDPPWVQLTQALLAIARLLTPGDSAEGAFVDLLFLVGGRGNANASPNRAFFPSRDEWLRKVAVKLGPRSTEEWLHLVLQAREAVDKSGFGGRNLPETIGKLGSAIEAIGENKRPRGSQLRWWVLWAEVATAWLSRATGASKSKCSSFVTCFLIENASDHPDPEFDGITTRRGLNSLMPDIAEQIPTDSSGRRGKPAKERILHDRSKWRCDKWKLGIAEDGSWPKDVNAGIALALALLDIRSPE